MAKLNLWIGRANTGKSRRVLEAIRALGDTSQQILIVPDHASHQAERDLCDFCGPTACRHAEALSLRLLANRVLSLTGGNQDGVLDAGGKLLLMQAALSEVLPALTVYARPSRRPPFLQELVGVCSELTAYNVTPEALGDAAAQLEGLSRDKVRDLSLIYAAYLRLLTANGRDRRDLPEKLLENLVPSGYTDEKDVFIDGFSYFNAQEERLLSLLLRRARSVTITLLGEKCAEGREPIEIFRQGLRTRDRLTRLAREQGVPCEITYLPPPPVKTALGHLEAYFFAEEDRPGSPWAGKAENICLHRADNRYAEAEYAAAHIRQLVRSGACRYRDITITAGDMEAYAPILETVFARYQVPLYLSRRSAILDKPVLCLITGVLEAVSGGYEYEDMFRFLKTGLAGLTLKECDLLESYVLTWDIHGAMWVRPDPFTANPSGWKEDFTPGERTLLDKLNRAKEKVGVPLGRLAEGMREGKTAREKLKALWRYLEEIGLPAALERQRSALESAGELQQAQETGQLWELLLSILDQFADTLGGMEMDRENFTRLFKLVVTQYDVGTIPAALDQVRATQIDRNERRQVRHLLILGATDGTLPSIREDTGLLTREDRSALLELGVELAPWGAELLERELQNLYAALAQPRDSLTILWPASDSDGTALRPSFVVGRVRALLPGVEETADDSRHLCRLSAPLPALELAGQCLTAYREEADRPAEDPLWTYFASQPAYLPRLTAMERAAWLGRGRLSPQAVEVLYGKRYRLSASRVERLNTCHFAYFMEYGLRAKERRAAGFDALQVGTFLHYVLENVVQRTEDLGGFTQVDEKALRSLINQVIDEYVRTALPGFDRREQRFQYLFRRLTGTVATIVENVAEELRQSDFRPVAFELEFGGDGKANALPAITLSAASPADGGLELSGKVDRVDGWLHDGKLYLKVVDYKTGRKAFDIADVQYGLNIQMLLYLFALQHMGRAYFGGLEIVPAGVSYLPARDVLLTAPRDIGEDALRRAMDRELRRSGLVLNQPEVLHAMEHSSLDEARFLPLSLGRDGGIVKGAATAEELGKLGRHVEKLLERVVRELKEGNIDADPHGHGSDDSPCLYCAFAKACGFVDGRGGERMTTIRPVSEREFFASLEG